MRRLGPTLTTGVILIAIVALLMAFDAVVGIDTYRQHLIVLIAIFVMLASSLNLLMGYSGLVSLGHTAFFGLGAYVSGILTVREEWPFLAGVASALVVALVAGHAIGRVALRLRGASFVIATLAVAEGLRLVALNWQEMTGGPAGLLNVPPISLFGQEILRPGEVYPVMLGFAIVVVMLVARLVHSSLGTSMLAMRDHELLAEELGIDPTATARKAFVVGGMMASFAGALYAHYVGFVSPEVFSFTMMITMLLMVVAGGMGTIAGPILGAVAFTWLPEVLRFSDQWRLILYGSIMLAIVRFAPRGIWGSLISAWERLSRSRRPRQPAVPTGPSPPSSNPPEPVTAGRRTQ